MQAKLLRKRYREHRQRLSVYSAAPRKRLVTYVNSHDIYILVAEPGVSGIRDDCRMQSTCSSGA
jgi:hypothetical protein